GLIAYRPGKIGSDGPAVNSGPVGLRRSLRRAFAERARRGQGVRARAARVARIVRSTAAIPARIMRMPSAWRPRRAWPRPNVRPKTPRLPATHARAIQAPARG